MQYVKTGEKLKSHFMSHVTKSENGCWNWDKVSVYGYGQYCHNYKTYRAHRFSWMIFIGDIPNKLYVLHKCDNRRCVNPDHLFLGTHDDNMKDAHSKKRHVHLDSHAMSKLTVKERKKIIEEFFDGATRKELAKKYNVHHRTIQNTINHPELKKDRFGSTKILMEDIPILQKRYKNCSLSYIRRELNISFYTAKKLLREGKTDKA